MSIKITLEKQTVNELNSMLDKARYVGDLRTVTRIKAVLALGSDHPIDVIASVLCVRLPPDIAISS